MKVWHVVAGLAVAAILVGMMYVGGYNSRVRSYEAGIAQLQQVANVQQRQFELLPNLVDQAREFADHERGMMNDVIAKRQAVTQLNMDVSKLANDPAALQKLIDAQNSFAGAMRQLMVVAERYPNVKASEHYLALQAETAGSANRISTERGRYINIARNHNASMKTFFGAMFYAGKFPMLAEFKADAEATQPFRMQPRSK